MEWWDRRGLGRLAARELSQACSWDKQLVVSSGRAGIEWPGSMYWGPPQTIHSADEVMDGASKDQTVQHPLTRMRGVNAALIGKLVRVKVRHN